MRNFTTRIQNKANALALRARMALSNQRGDFYISDAVKIIIAVVLGALLLAALTLIFNDTVIPRTPVSFQYPKRSRRLMYSSARLIPPVKAVCPSITVIFR